MTRVPKKALIRLREAPRKPKRQNKTITARVDDGCRLSQTMALLGNPPIEECFFEFEYYGYDGGCDVSLAFNREETDEEFGARMDKYLDRKATYDEWYKLNKDTIEAEKQRRRDLATERARVQIEREKARLEKALRKLDNGTDRR